MQRIVDPCGRVVSAVAAVVAAGVLVAAQAPQPPVFRAGVDLVVVEATVVDRSGAVVTGLTADDFEVEIGGRGRDVVSAVLVSHDTAPADRAHGDDISTNVGAATGRTILLVVDQTSLKAQSRGVLEGTRRWIATLAPNDRVGLASIPAPGPRVEFTAEHERILDAIGKVSPAPDRKSALQMVRNVSLWEGLSIAGGDVFVRSEVVARECRAGDLICPTDIDMIAREVQMDAEFRVRRVLPHIGSLMRGLAQLPGPKHVILISSGWPITPRSAATEISPIAAEAALANATIHTFTAEQWALSAAVSRPSKTEMQDRDILLSSVEMLSGLTGGQAARLLNDGDDAFRALSAGLAGYYRLGVRVDADELDGKARRIAVKVKRRGLSLSAYRRVMAAAPPVPAAEVADPAAILRAAVEAPAVSTDLALRATSYVLHDEGNTRDTVRVLAVGDVARATPGAASSIAVLYDLEGRPVAGGRQRLDVSPSETGSFQFIFTVKPGSYRLRVGARDGEGRVGTVERGVDAGWTKAGDAETTGLVLLRVASLADGAAEPVFASVSTADTVVAQLAIEGKPGRPPAEVVIDVTERGARAPMFTRPASLTKTTASVTLARETIPIALLPPGDYTIGVTVRAGATARLTRGLAVDAAGAPAARPPAGALLELAAIPRFAIATVLDDALLASALGQLAERPDATLVRHALPGLAAGPWPTDAAGGPLAAAPVASTFVAGLGHLSDGRIDAAAREFRSTLRVAPDFTPALLYLGACLAAGKRDGEAAGAWQAALARERDLPLLASLAIDAWLRGERPTQALALATEARARWPDEVRFAHRQAVAALASGDREHGLDLVLAMPSPDAPLLLMALGALYEAARDGTPVWDAARDATLAASLREKYTAAGGDRMPLVEAWSRTPSDPGRERGRAEEQ